MTIWPNYSSNILTLHVTKKCGLEQHFLRDKQFLVNSFVVSRGTDTIYLFIVMLHATTQNLNCFTNNQILYILKLFFLLTLQSYYIKKYTYSYD
jgi:hypothetical protein